MEMAMRLMEMAETAMETDRDGSRDQCRWLWGHFLVPAGCQNRDFYPPKFIDDGGRVAELFLENFADSPRVFRPEALYR
jgi:hypothetical protein